MKINYFWCLVEKNALTKIKSTDCETFRQGLLSFPFLLMALIAVSHACKLHYKSNLSIYFEKKFSFRPIFAKSIQKLWNDSTSISWWCLFNSSGITGLCGKRNLEDHLGLIVWQGRISRSLFPCQHSSSII